MLDTYLTGIALAYGAFVLGILSPGPNVLAVIGTSMATGRQAGKALALGIATGSLIWGLLTLFGLTALLVFYAELLAIVKVAGAAYLLWLAFKAFRSALSRGEQPVAALSLRGGGWSYYRRGLLIQMTNPKAALTWLAIMSLAIGDGSPWWVGGIVVAGTALISVAGHLGYSVLFSTRRMVRAYRSARRWIDATLGMFFSYASYRIITTET